MCDVKMAVTTSTSNLIDARGQAHHHVKRLGRSGIDPDLLCKQGTDSRMLQKIGCITHGVLHGFHLSWRWLDRRRMTLAKTCTPGALLCDIPSTN